MGTQMGSNPLDGARTAVLSGGEDVDHVAAAPAETDRSQRVGDHTERPRSFEEKCQGMFLVSLDNNSKLHKSEPMSYGLRRYVGRNECVCKVLVDAKVKKLSGLL